MRIKINKEDKLFSEMIRERDGKCKFCGKKDVQLQCSHFWGRGWKGTRFSAKNCDALCFRCHMQNEGNKQGYYREYKLIELGEAGYRELEILSKRSVTYKKSDKELIYKKLKSQRDAGLHLTKDWQGVLYW